MTTLRRELISRIKDILGDYLGEDGIHSASERLADAVLELRAFQPKVNLKRADPAWAMLAGEEVSEEAQEENILAKDATDAFERDLKFNPLPWSSNKEWEKLEAFVVAEYKKDNLIFTKYKTWQQGDGKYAAMSNRQIKAKPADFIACWPDFLAHSAMNSRPSAEAKTDASGAPITY